MTHMFMHKTSLFLKLCVLFPHTRYTEVYMDLYTPRCACVHMQKPSHFAAPLITGGHSRQHSLPISLNVQNMFYLFIYLFSKLLGRRPPPLSPLCRRRQNSFVIISINKSFVYRYNNKTILYDKAHWLSNYMYCPIIPDSTAMGHRK